MEKTLTQQMLNKYLHDHQKEIFEDFAYTISFPSVKSAAEDGAPFGRECARCLDACRGLFEKYGFKTEMYADLGYALAYFDKKPVDGDEYTAMLAHTDVVPVTPEDWVLTEPFKMIDTGENLVGRGVSDDKDGVIASLYLFRAMKDLGYTPKHPFVVFLGSNEEAGMQDVRNYKANQKPLPKVCLVPDSSFPASFGERGNFHAEVKSKEVLKSILKIEGGKANNIVLAKMTCTLEKLPGLVEFLKNNPKDYIQYKEQDETVELEVSGIPAHGSIPFKGDSAFARFSSFLAKFEGLSEPDAHIIRECAAMLSDCYGIDFGIEDDDPEMGKLTVGNARVYKEDGKLGLTLDIRFGCRVPNDVVKQKLNDNLEARGFTLTTSRGSIAFRIDPECKLAKTLLDTYRKASGNPDAKYFYMTGGTYSKIMQPESVSFSTGAHCDGYIERLGLPAGHGNVHEADETVGKEEFLNGIEYLGLIYLDIDKAY